MAACNCTIDTNTASGLFDPVAMMARESTALQPRIVAADEALDSALLDQLMARDEALRDAAAHMQAGSREGAKFQVDAISRLVQYIADEQSHDLDQLARDCLAIQHALMSIRAQLQ
jgi:hypothetical protein